MTEKDRQLVSGLLVAIGNLTAAINNLPRGISLTVYPADLTGGRGGGGGSPALGG